MTRTWTLWRVADREQPWFGRGSYWALSRAFAIEVGHIIAGTGLLEPCLYTTTVEVDDADVFELGNRFTPSTSVEDVVAKYVLQSGRKVRWVRFYEAGWRDEVHHQIVYFGEGPVTAEVAS
jgi:hypothetical protein